MDSIQSHTIITAYLGDTIFVSKNPDLTDELQKEKGTQNGNTFDNPRYIIYEGLDKLYVKEMPDSEGKIIYGFDGYKRNDDIITDAFVKSRHGVTYMTHTRNLIIPLILPNWHNLGFEKRPMPPGLHERLIVCLYIHILSLNSDYDGILYRIITRDGIIKERRKAGINMVHN